MWSKKLGFVSKTMFLLGLFVFSLCASAHTSISVSVGGGPVYYPAPTYYGPPAYARNVVWVPGHQEYQYWVPGHYVEYIAPAPRPEMIWMGDEYRGHHGHWHH